MISKTFPSYHSRNGEPTHFKEKILEGKKIHTIRQNFALCEKRAKKVNAGLAVVSLREWEGLPRKSRQVEIMQLERIGLQKIEIAIEGSYIDDTFKFRLSLDTIAYNDGLARDDFKQWFHDCPDNLMALIHFTDFKY